MAPSAAAWAERATGDVLISPDWAINMELCDTINKYPGQAKDALKVIKKRLGSKRPIIQLLTLSVLDAIIKNCGDNVIQQIIKHGILFEMASMVKKKPNINVREKMLILIDTWQEAIGVKFPQFIHTFYSLRDSEIEFPPREESNVTLFNPPQAKQSAQSTNFHKVGIPVALEDSILPLSLAEMQSAQELVDVLMEMLDALDPTNSNATNQELIVDLAEQCRGYQKRVQSLINSTFDETLLFQGLAMNDNLQHILRRHEEIANGITFATPVKPDNFAPSFFGVRHQEDDAEDDFCHMAPRSQARRSTSNSKAAQAIPSVAPPSFSRMPYSKDTRAVDYLSGDIYTSDRPFETSKSNFSSPGSIPPSAPPSPFRYAKQFMYDDPASLARPSDATPPESWEPKTTTSLPPPPAKTAQRQQFLEQQGDSSTSSDNLYISSHSTPPRDKESEDALFRDLVDFAKARASPSSSASKSNRSY